MRLRFGDVTLDSDSRQILRGDEAVHVSPKAFALLQLLIDRHPAAVSKAEIFDHLWPKTFVSEANLAVLVAEIRTATGDSAREPRYIRTLHGYGYAFCGQLTPLAGARPDDRTGGRLWWLLLDTGPLELGEGEHIVGRDSDAAVRLTSSTVSRRHARLIITPSAATIEDLNSKNGTFVGGQPVTGPTALTDGDEIRIGSVAIGFRNRIGSDTTQTIRLPARDLVPAPSAVPPDDNDA